jgi:hypothetical protein
MTINVFTPMAGRKISLPFFKGQSWANKTRGVIVGYLQRLDNMPRCRILQL